MNQAIKAEWIAELRSGTYQQGIGVLRTKHNTYCCLGVLCTLAARAGVGTWDEDQPDDFRFTATSSSATRLPLAVRKWAGLDASDPVVAGTALSIWNDGEYDPDEDAYSGGQTFPEIADLIEAHL